MQRERSATYLVARVAFAGMPLVLVQVVVVVGMVWGFFFFFYRWTR